MTKIKNTKKGMAKKTLSISLAVAMLATSNVPVWAAEFSDGTDAAFTSEAVVETPVEEAPVVEEEVAPEVETVTTLNGYTVDTNMELKDGDWSTNLTLDLIDGVTGAAKFEVKDANKEPVNVDSVQVWMGNSKATTLTVTDGNVAAALATYKVGLDNYKHGTVTVKAMVKGTVVFEDSAVIKAADISDGSWTATPVNFDAVYDGTAKKPVATVTKDIDGKIITADVIYKYEEEKEAVNVKEKGYHFVMEGVTDSGFTGVIDIPDWRLQILPAIPTSDNLSVVISGDATYNGKNVQPTVVITDKLTNKVLPKELYTVSVRDGGVANVGTYNKENLSIVLEQRAKVGTATEYTYNNFSSVDVADLATGEFNITKLDLSKMNEKYDVTISDSFKTPSVLTPTKSDLTFKDKSGNVVPVEKALPWGDLEIIAENFDKVGTATITIRPKSAADANNVTGEYKLSFSIREAVASRETVYLPAGVKIDGIALPEATSLSNIASLRGTTLENEVYTGSVIEPLKEIFSKVGFKNTAGGFQSFTLGTDYDLVYAENTDSKVVSGKNASVKLVFKGAYSGVISYDFVITQAEASVSGKDITYAAGKTSYDVAAKVVVKDVKGNEVAVPEKDYTVTTTKFGDLKNKQAKGVVVFDNKNYTIKDGITGSNGYWNKEIVSNIVKKNLKDCTATIEGDYVFTGEELALKLTVKDGNVVLVEGKDYRVSHEAGTVAGVAHAIVEALPNSWYTGTITVDYTIKKANLKDAVVKSTHATDKKNFDVSYTGYPTEAPVGEVYIGKTLLKKYDPKTKTGDYTVTWDKDAIEVGTYNFTITAVGGNSRVEGEYKGTFKVIPATLAGAFAQKLNLNATVEAGTILDVDTTGAKYTGKEITIEQFETKYVVVKANTKTVLTEGKDYRLEYKNNVDAGIATVTAYGLGNYAATDSTGKPVPVATMQFQIAPKAVITSSMIKDINDVEYAGGLPVEPEVVIVDAKGNRLIQGVDYTVEAKKWGTKTPITEVTGKDESLNNYDLTVKGLGAYLTTEADNDNVTYADYENKEIHAVETITWKVTKKDMKNTTVTVDKNDNVIVMNGSVIVPSTEYTVAFSTDGSKVTVTAKEDSKNYTGSKEQDVDMAKVGQAMIKEVKVVGNKATVVLSDKVENAEGYDFVIATEADYKNGRVDITKNQLKTSGDFTYVQKGVYYAYCHAWKRDENNQKVFGDWSNLFQFTVSATTPETPVITSVKRSGKNVTVTYKNAKNAEGYDVVLGSKRTKVNGELRPVEYGKLVQKNKTTTTVTFKNVPKGSYYVGMHAYNRSSVDNKKVFSRWANWSSRVTVK